MDGVVQVEVAVVECGWTSCSCVKKVPKMMTALDLHGRVADCLQAAVADRLFRFLQVCACVFFVVFHWSDCTCHV